MPMPHQHLEFPPCLRHVSTWSSHPASATSTLEFPPGLRHVSTWSSHLASATSATQNRERCTGSTVPVSRCNFKILPRQLPRQRSSTWTMMKPNLHCRCSTISQRLSRSDLAIARSAIVIMRAAHGITAAIHKLCTCRQLPCHRSAILTVSNAHH